MDFKIETVTVPHTSNGQTLNVSLDVSFTLHINSEEMNFPFVMEQISKLIGEGFPGKAAYTTTK